MGSYLATKHLIDAGHRTIGYIGGPKWAVSTQELEEGYRKAHHEGGVKINEKLIVGCEYDEDEAKKKFINLKTDNPLMTAVHCAQSVMAMGTLTGTAELGLNVPGDISIICSGSTKLVSSINQRFDEIGRTVVKVLLAYMGGKEFPMKSVVAPELAPRNSVAKIKI
jgi:LacI family transcriptional regulator